MLVVEDRHDAAARFEYVQRLLKETVAGIEGLGLFVFRVGAMFGDDQHSVNAQARTAEGQRLGHGRVEPDPMPARAVPAEVAFGELVHVKAGEFQAGIMGAPLPARALQNASAEMWGVGKLAKFVGGE